MKKLNIVRAVVLSLFLAFHAFGGETSNPGRAGETSNPGITSTDSAEGGETSNPGAASSLVTTITIVINSLISNMP